MTTRTHTESHIDRRKHVAGEDVQRSHLNHVSLVPTSALKIQRILSIPIRFVPATHSTYEDEASMNPKRSNGGLTIERWNTSDPASEHGENVSFPFRCSRRTVSSH